MNDHDFSPTQSERPTRAARKPRADGAESRRAILQAAATLATTRGLDALSLGELARHIGMSKSGLFAHFKSKEELELATIETAAEVFAAEVLRPAADSPGGLARVYALSETFLGHLERRVFPGGCFFATVSVQLAASPGRPATVSWSSYGSGRRSSPTPSARPATRGSCRAAPTSIRWPSRSPRCWCGRTSPGS